MKCPVCKKKRHLLEGKLAPLYQQSYEGEPGHITPRCNFCFARAIKEQDAN